MNNEILLFHNDEFGDVRTVIIDGEPWFVAKDVAVALGYVKVLGITTSKEIFFHLLRSTVMRTSSEIVCKV